MEKTLGNLLFALSVGEEGVEATAGEASLDVCAGQPAETGGAGCHHCASTRSSRHICHIQI